ncbi:hypothetical protein PybrP1_007602 [[Pythium] brassicae (nom. inval.)]|nr:hypothetical protein PybrP1_007602 [[Pythium] brassicae (nom. inval.)]
MAQPSVVVLGAGISGLTSALALLESGYSRVRIVAAATEGLVSHVAGAIWMPFALPANVSPHKPRKWCEVSMAWLTRIWEQHGESATGIHFVKGVDVSGDGTPAVVHPYWAHCVRDFRLLSKQEAEAICPGTAHGFAFETIVYNPTVLMKWLRAQIESRGGTFELRRVADLGELACDVLVFNPSIKQFRMVVHANAQHTYILPRPGGEVVLGGTVQPGNWSAETSEEDVRAIWERCCALCPAVRESRVLGYVAGLRPGRTNSTRVELDPRRSASGALVIHNYGHAGSGHTLQWGCAQDVVTAAREHCPPGLSSASRL